MKTKYIVMAMALMLYAISGCGQLPNASIRVADHVMYSSDWDQFMPSIAVDKNNAPNLLVSFSTSSYTLHHEDNYQGWYYFSPTGSISPVGQTSQMPHNALSFGYPSVSFDAGGRGYLAGGNSDITGFFVVSTDDQCQTWSNASNHHVTVSNGIIAPMGNADDVLNSPYANHYYMVWNDGTNLPSGNANIYVARSTDEGHIFIENETPLNDYCTVGPNIQTGADGEVYVCWEDYGTIGLPTPALATSIGFASSRDGGATFTSPGLYTGNDFRIPNNALQDDPNANNTNPDYNNTFVNSYPSMAVDKSCDPTRRGRIYIVAATASGSGSVINLWYSNDKGGTWNNTTFPTPLVGITISQSNLDHCWFPWVAVDDMTGVVSVVYYGSQGSVVGNTNTYVAFSDPTDPTMSTWGNIQVSSAAQTPASFSPAHKRHPGYPLKYNYANGIASYGGHAYPVWQDGRSGTWQIWTADISYDAPQLASSATNLHITPPSGVTISISASPVVSMNYEAADEIVIAGSGGDVSITGTSNASMTAGHDILIKQGFSTQPGAVFTAEIKTDITSCQTPGVQSFKTNLPNTTSSDNIIIKKDENGVNVFAYPNPTTDLITVGISNNNYNNVSFTVTDMSGRLISQYNNATISGNNVTETIWFNPLLIGIGFYKLV
jgi:hypothetical protein